MKGGPIEYSQAELLFLELLRRLPRKVLHAEFVAWTGRTDVSVDNIKAVCSRKGWNTGRSGCFKPGHRPANKGKKVGSHPNARQTQFKKGHLPKNTRYLGHEAVRSDGYLYISVAERNPHTGFERRYVQKHKWLWERKNGPIPAGHCLKSLDGDRLNTDPDNWICIPRAMLPRLNGIFGRDYDNAPPDLKPTILATARLAHAAYEAKKDTA